MKAPKIQIWDASTIDKDDWCFRLKHANGKVACHGHGYNTKRDAIRGALDAQRAFAKAKIFILQQVPK